MKPVSGYKLKVITGSGIFVAGGENNIEETDAANTTPANKTGLRMYQKSVAGISHISFGEEESVSPKKALSEAKQRELSGTLDSESDSKLKKQFSNAKNKELSGHNIFAPSPEIKPHTLGARALALRESISIGESDPTYPIIGYGVAKVLDSGHSNFKNGDLVCTDYYLAAYSWIWSC